MCLKQFCTITAATLLLLLPAFASEASSATAYTTYTMTAAEMSALDSRLNLLLEQTKATKQALAESQAALSKSKTELSKLKTESIKLQIELQAQSSLLESANKSLQASAREEKRIKRQRLLWQIIAGGMVVALVKQ